MLGLLEKVEHSPVGTTMMGTTRPTGVIKITVATCAASFLQFPNFKMKHITVGVHTSSCLSSFGVNQYLLTLDLASCKAPGGVCDKEIGIIESPVLV